MTRFGQAVFERAVHELSDLPPPAQPEIAFAGRSNAGKSSAINAIAHRRKLAFTSKTPGRTQQIVMFRLPGGQYVVDLPGYGYAKVPDELRRHWEGTLGRYLGMRESLRGLVLIMDSRHPMTELDQRMLDWFAPTGKPVHVLLTKADKLGRAEAARTLAAVRRALAKWGKQCTAQLFSSTSKTGVAEAEDLLAGWLGIEREPAPAKKGPSGDARAGTRRPRTKGDKREAKMP
ncbi:MAG: ribosome biogenesis GTP-binding protein YihA/YsxC [Burkholderiales bacterium]|nr:ribosome biogenesis GTP-binding protein YihA/YsxC [Burkholderiales bacterium]